MTDSVGARLRQGRELRGLTLQQASESTKVRAHYLQALENDDYTAIPSAAQARGFLRIYAEFLELDPGDLVPPTVATPATDLSPAAEAPASPPGRPSLWGNLLGRFVRRPKKESLPASAPSVPGEPLPEVTAEQAAPAAVVPAATDAKTIRHRKGVGDSASGTADVKKNVRE